MLQIENLSFSFPSHQILQGLCLDLCKGEIGTLIGLSGSGKTTFLKLLTGLLKPTAGLITIDAKATPTAFKEVSYLTQDDLLLPWRTLFNNLMLVGELGTAPKAPLKDEALFYLNEMGLSAWKDAYPHEISGGMRKRVALARVLLQKKPVLLMDEPFAALDVSLREQMYVLLHDIRSRLGTTMLMVTHDFRDALSLSDQIFVLSEGKISQKWTVDSNTRNTPALHQQALDEMRQALLIRPKAHL